MDCCTCFDSLCFFDVVMQETPEFVIKTKKSDDFSDYNPKFSQLFWIFQLKCISLQSQQGYIKYKKYDYP